ncbi:MAG: glycosyltransferase family 9 protein [Opitutales bacterium]|jgi:ADP-heptose:LPS heptosyltransferase
MDTPATRSTWLQLGPTRPGWRGRLDFSLRTRLSRWGRSHLAWLSRWGARVTVRDLFSTPGDTLLTAIVCRHLKQTHPRLRLNVITKNPDLLRHDPHVAELNGPPGCWVIDFWYLDLQQRRDRTTNVLASTIASLGVGPLEYRARVFLTEAERTAARARLAGLRRPFIAFNTLSAQPVKNWPLAQWNTLLPELARHGTLVHLGDNREPELPNVTRFAGALTMRESMAVLAECSLHLGPDSFLMHAANGLDVPSVIIFGGSRTPANLGYAANRNLYTELPCSGCWLTGHAGSECPHDLACMAAITPASVLQAADELLARRSDPAVTPASP